MVTAGQDTLPFVLLGAAQLRVPYSSLEISSILPQNNMASDGAGLAEKLVFPLRFFAHRRRPHIHVLQPQRHILRLFRPAFEMNGVLMIGPNSTDASTQRKPRRRLVRYEVARAAGLLGRNDVSEPAPSGEDLFGWGPSDDEDDSDNDSVTTNSTEETVYAAEEEFVVSRILAHRYTEEVGETEYLMEWLGYTKEKNSWVTAGEFCEVTAALEEYKQNGPPRDFDLERWEQRQAEARLAKEGRQKRRQRKLRRRQQRMKRRLLAASSPPEEAPFDSDSELLDKDPDLFDSKPEPVPAKKKEEEARVVSLKPTPMKRINKVKLVRIEKEGNVKEGLSSSRTPEKRLYKICSPLYVPKPRKYKYPHRNAGKWDHIPDEVRYKEFNEMKRKAEESNEPERLYTESEIRRFRRSNARWNS